MELWLPGYPHEPINAGLSWTEGTAWKVGAHSTETPPGSAPGIIASWRQNPGRGLSHFIANRPTDIRQLLPLNVGGYTAQNPAGGIDTNRAHIVQIEVCNYAINPDMLISPNNPGLGFRIDWSDEWYEGLGQWLADLDAALDGALDLTTELVFGDRWVGFPGGSQAYLDFAGVCGHQHIPEQPDRHWDPGELDIRRLLAIARGDQQEDDMPYNSWPQADKDALITDLTEALTPAISDTVNMATGKALSAHLGDILGLSGTKVPPIRAQVDEALTVAQRTFNGVATGSIDGDWDNVLTPDGKLPFVPRAMQ